MARVFIDGFESGDYSLWDSNYQDGSGNVYVASAQTGMSGTYNLVIQWQGWLQKNLPAADSYYTLIRWKYNTTGAWSCILSFYSDTTLIGYLIRDTTTGLLKAYVGTTLVATGIRAVSTADPNIIEVYYLIADSGGRIIVKLNGLTEIDYTGDTKSGSATTMNRFRVGDNGNRIGGAGYVDDVVIDDSSWIGNSKIQAIVPNGAGNSTQWTPSTGSNYACVDEKPYSDADYVSVNSVDQIDLYTHGDVSASVNTIKSIQQTIRSFYEGTPGAGGLYPALRINGTDYFATAKTLSTTPTNYTTIWEESPDTSSAFTPSEVNALEAGFKSTT